MSVSGDVNKIIQAAHMRQCNVHQRLCFEEAEQSHLDRWKRRTREIIVTLSQAGAHHSVTVFPRFPELLNFQEPPHIVDQSLHVQL
jgi:hypothetical protein